MGDRHTGDVPAREAVRVIPVPPTGLLTVLVCGPLVGILTHWRAGRRGRSMPCPGHEACPPNLHRVGATWYGYAPARVFEGARQLWRPAVLEITESLEELWRGRDLAGQVWGLMREKSGGRVEALYLESRVDELLTSTFDVRPAVARMYHTGEIKWGVANPTPPRVMASAVEAVGPAALADLATQPIEPASRQQIERLKRAGAGHHQPTAPPQPPPGAVPSTNGRNGK